MEELEDTDSDATTCDPDWVDLSSDIEVIPDTQCTSTLHPLTPSPTPPIPCQLKSKEPLCIESGVTSEPRLQNEAAYSWSSASRGEVLTQPLVHKEEAQLTSTPDQVCHVVRGCNESGREWRTVDRKKEADVNSPTRELGTEKRRAVQEDSDYCSGTEQAVSRNDQQSPLSAKTTPLQKDMGFDEPFFERPRFPHSPPNPRRPLVLSPPGVTPVVEVPATMKQYLRDYQQEGVQFLYSRYSSNAGGVLCDDMGLGKTVQVIAFMCAVLGKTGTKADVVLTDPRQPIGGKGSFLVVCPSSVLYNWTSEIELWSHLKCGVYHRGKKSEVLDRVKRSKLEVVVTTHDTARTHVEELNTVNWLAVICDEVQTIKGTSAQVTAAMNSLQAKRRFGLTGTALQNNLSELWSILNWANPGCLGTLSSFHDNFEKPILEGQKFDCTKRQLAQGRWKLAELEELMKECMLRRTKALIASQLPKKEEFVVFCPITELQETIYCAILDCEDVQLILHSGEPCNCYSGSKRGECCYQTNGEGVEWQYLVNEYVCLLTKCANHLGLLLPDKTPSKRQKQKANQVCQEVFSKHPIFTEMSKQASLLTLSDPQYCGKMRVLEKLLSKFQEEKSKVIIFSISVKLLDVVENYLVSKGHLYCRLDGSTKIEERSSLVRSFNADPTQFVFLISKKCGGVGLNITGANRVIIFDPSWNPATDLQAEDRAFRIGQSRDVKVYRFISEATVEENIYLRQVYKQQLANMAMEGSKERRYFSAVAGDKKQQGELFGYSNLFKVHRPGSNLTLDILKRADKLEAGVKMAADQLHVVEEATETRQMCSAKSGTIVQGTTVLVHSGGRSVVGNSRVEEHISKQALTDVYELQQHSQEPANIVEKMEEFSDESDDVDYQPPPPKKYKHTPPPPLPAAVRQTGAKKARPSVPEQSCEEGEGRHDHFERTAEKFGSSFSHESPLHERDAESEERQRVARGEVKKAEGKGKERLMAATTPPAKRGRRLPESVKRRPIVKKRKMRKPAIEFEDYSPPSLSTKTSCDSSNEEQKHQISPEVHMDTSTSNFTPLEFTKAERHPPSSKASRPPMASDGHTQVHKDLLLPPSFCTERSPSPPPQPLSGNSSTMSSTINEILFEVGYHGNTEVKATTSKTQTMVDHKVKYEPSINIDELFGL